MILKNNTYLVCNSGHVPRLRQISHFKLNLGQSLIDKQNKFIPQDLNIQKHYIFHNTIIQLCGYIGSLPIYTNPSHDLRCLEVCNEKESLMYTIEDNMSMYDNVNSALGLFFDRVGITTPVTKVEDAEPVAVVEYVRPNKKLSEMTMDERIAFLRNRK